MSSACSHSHGHTHRRRRHRRRIRANADGKDPVPAVKTRMDAYRRAFTRRFDTLRAVLRESIVDRDAAHLRANADIDPADSFGFGANADKRDAFDSWLEQSIDDGVLEVVDRDAIRGGRHYTATHTRDSYEKGLEWADQRMQEAGVPTDAPVTADFRRGVHADQLEQLYLRNYRGLEKITDELDADISRTFGEALSEGVNPREAGRRLSDDVNTYRNRAETLARTEFQNSHSTAAANRYQEYGVEQVRILTADPCDICASLAASGPYPVEDAAGLLPQKSHPNCVCSLSPVTE